MAQIPGDRLLLETDSPYCDVRPSHAGKGHVKTARQAKDKKKYDKDMLVKGRNEPCNLVSVFEVVSGELCSLLQALHAFVLLNRSCALSIACKCSCCYIAAVGHRPMLEKSKDA